MDAQQQPGIINLRKTIVIDEINSILLACRISLCESIRSRLEQLLQEEPSWLLDPHLPSRRVVP